MIKLQTNSQTFKTLRDGNFLYIGKSLKKNNFCSLFYKRERRIVL
jgi:hypothetical protein